MSAIIKGMSLPKHADVNGEKDTAYKCLILAHPDNSVELVIDTAFASPYDNGHNIQRYPLTEKRREGDGCIRNLLPDR